MWQYIVIGLAVALGVIFHDFRVSDLILDRKVSDKLWNFWFIAIFFALILLAGLRYRIGIDTILLRGEFEMYMAKLDPHATSRISQIKFGEPRHFLIVAYLKSLGIDMWLWQILCACALNIPLAIAIRKNTDKWFSAILFYLMFAFIMLNFETMLEGAATGMLIWALGDIRKGRLWNYYLKLLIGMFFHLSIIVMVLLPLIYRKRVIDMFRNTRYLFIFGLCVIGLSLMIKYFIIHFAWIMDMMPWLPSERFTSGYIRTYAEELLAPLNLNWRGYIGFFLINILLPFWIALILLKGSGGGRTAPGEKFLKGHISGLELIGVICYLLGLLGLMTVVAGGFVRISMYFWAPACVGMAMALDRVRVWRLGLLSAIILIGTLKLYGLSAPIEHTQDRYVAEIYIPYSSYITKGVNYRREWLSHNYYCYECNIERTPVYDFGFSLFEGEKEIPSVFWPEITHASMEKKRISIQGDDSIAYVKPMAGIRDGK